MLKTSCSSWTRYLNSSQMLLATIKEIETATWSSKIWNLWIRRVNLGRFKNLRTRLGHLSAISKCPSLGDIWYQEVKHREGMNPSQAPTSQIMPISNRQIPSIPNCNQSPSNILLKITLLLNNKQTHLNRRYLKWPIQTRFKLAVAKMLSQHPLKKAPEASKPALANNATKASNGPRHRRHPRHY